MRGAEWSKVSPELRDKLQVALQAAPIKLSILAELLGLKVVATPLPPGISGEIRPDQSIPGGYLVKVNKGDSARRQRFTVAHEIAHYLLHRDQIGNGISDDVLYRSTLSDRREAQANRLAADILMPDNLIREWLSHANTLGLSGEKEVVEFMSDKFNVSEAAMRIRLGLKEQD